jgi:diacylglycerol kinase (ATP)
MLVAAKLLPKLLDFTRGIFHRPLHYNLTRTRRIYIPAKKNTVLIYNPNAGRFKRGGDSLIQRALVILARHGHDVTVAPTTGPGTAGGIARAHLDRGAELVVGAGGDGTINEIAEGMIGSPAPLAVLPGGTANVLAVETKLGLKLDRAAERIEHLRPRRISVGHLKCDGGRVSRHFLLMAGIGLDAHIVYRVNAALKARTGKFAYWIAGWSLLGRRLAEFEVEIDGQKRTCSFALISKVRNYGGDFSIARSVSMLDDRFEVVLFEGRSSLRYVKYFAGLAFNRIAGMSGVTVLQASRIVASCPGDNRIYVQIDGEYAGRLPAEIKIVPDALTLMLPEEYGGKR